MFDLFILSILTTWFENTNKYFSDSTDIKINYDKKTEHIFMLSKRINDFNVKSYTV